MFKEIKDFITNFGYIVTNIGLGLGTRFELGEIVARHKMRRRRSRKGKIKKKCEVKGKCACAVNRFRWYLIWDFL